MPAAMCTPMEILTLTRARRNGLKCPRHLSFDQMRKTLSVAMIAMNEEANLPRTLDSVKWADEIVVIDSGSHDRTLDIARSFGAKTMYHAFGGHGEQKNVALDQ